MTESERERVQFQAMLLKMISLIKISQKIDWSRKLISEKAIMFSCKSTAIILVFLRYFENLILIFKILKVSVINYLQNVWNSWSIEC